jgi:Endonuclease-reverse transcriptase
MLRKNLNCRKDLLQRTIVLVAERGETKNRYFAHQWGSRDTNEKAERLFEFIMSNKLEIIIRKKVTTCWHEELYRMEVLDLILSSSLLKSRFKDCQVSDEPSLSDHMDADGCRNDYKSPNSNSKANKLRALQRGNKSPKNGDFETKSINDSDDLNRAAEN